ncbi:exoglucanase-like protein 1 precursor [Clohesyomyces aquaticus]|uniref:Glucanase n=1 Tax=Clohesyomyces aquaticus TaxID=1231657 RepID=A0A1Y1YTQ6_9PLEO|nr:exoglucanase-like protein 1 precursor [Clohesyomyces aquaticus]
MGFSFALRVITAFLSTRQIAAQLIGKEQTEVHPKLQWKRCTGKGGNSCSNVAGELVIDANWRWLHAKDGYSNCYDGNKWNTTLCPDNKKCTANCALEGEDYSKTYGITAGSNALTLKFVTKGQYSTNIGSRVYLMKDASNYEIFKLIGNEFTFDVDLSQLPCGLNGALYFVSMPQKDMELRVRSYCDAQCARDLKYINGETNSEGWEPSSNDANAGVGRKGACCAEMDIWEANSISTALTPHSCQPEGYSVCTDTGCGGTYLLDRYAGTCDANGCDFNPFRVGVTDFYGKGMTVDTSKPFTVVTQFLGSGANLQEIKRFYVQNNVVIANPEPTIPGIFGNSLTQDWCDREKEVFQEEYGEGHGDGTGACMSLWDDHYANMLWLDSNYPTDADPSKPGVARGSCDVGSGVPADVESQNANAQVTFSNVKFGPVGSTFAQSGGT